MKKWYNLYKILCIYVTQVLDFGWGIVVVAVWGTLVCWSMDILCNRLEVLFQFSLWDQSHVTIVWNTRETGDINGVPTIFVTVGLDLFISRLGGLRFKPSVKPNPSALLTLVQKLLWNGPLGWLARSCKKSKAQVKWSFYVIWRWHNTSKIWRWHNPCKVLRIVPLSLDGLPLQVYP